MRHRRQLRVLAQQQALERERLRIARDIHDDLGANLTRISLLSQSALDKAAAAQPPVQEVSRIYTTARAMTVAMDEIVWAINPQHDKLESVAAYFADFVEEFLSQAGLRFQLEIPLTLPAGTLKGEIRHHLFLALKEALNNTVKHAHATEVVVGLEVRAGTLVLSVRDNGCGFQPEAKAGHSAGLDRARPGNGLENMRRRLEELGGRCTIESEPGHGTRVEFGIDLEP
jgi:signal transduction histidine kinase